MKKVNLEELEVESFVTSLSPEEQAQQKGGSTAACVTASSPGCASALVSFSILVSLSYISVTITSEFY